MPFREKRQGENVGKLLYSIGLAGFVKGRKKLMVVVTSIIMITLVVFISFSFLYLGYLMLRQKPVLIDSNVFIGIIGLGCFVIITGIITRVIMAGFKNWIILVFIPIYILIFFFIKKYLGDLIVFNIKKRALTFSIAEALSLNSPRFEERRGKIIIPWLDHHFTIINYPLLDTAIIYWNGERKGDVIENVSRNLKAIISRKKFNQFSWVGLAHIVVGMLLFLVSVWLTVAAFSRF
jgi:hypothetical protein